MPLNIDRVAPSEFERKIDSEKTILREANLARRYSCELSADERKPHEDELALIAEARTPLNELSPDEFNRYLDLFFKYMPKRPFHVKRSYRTGFICQKGKYKDKSGEYDRPCYDDLVAKMLDLDRWNLLNPTKKEEEYFWIALREPKKTRLSRIDFDNKQNCIGYYSPGKLFGLRQPANHLRLFGA